MKASVFIEYGPPEVLHLTEVAKPSPKVNEVLIRVHATPVNFADTLIRNFKAISPRKFHMPFLFWLIGKVNFGFRKPKITILGSEFAGEVEAVGKDVTRFRKGDQVFGYCGPRMGAYAEYVCMPENGVLAIKPDTMTYEEAAAIPYGAIMALNILRKIKLNPGQKILINGASGGIGPLLVQLASSQFGAQVTGVCGTQRLEYIKALGANRVIDYSKEDFVNSGETYHFIIDILGKLSFSHCQHSLEKNGNILFVSFKMKQILQMVRTSIFSGKKVICVLINEKAEDLIEIKKLVETGKIKSIIDKDFPLEQAAEAHRYAESGMKKGTVVITIP
jgi:NADPH:quinone reductase-like Zn-dependent oxidoreductase